MTSLSRDGTDNGAAARGSARLRRPASRTCDVTARATGFVRSQNSKACGNGVVRTHVTRHARAGREQSHYLELMLNALLRRPTVRRSSWAPGARLLRAWRPWSSPLGELLLDSVPWRWTTPPQRHEEKVWCIDRDVSPYVCDSPFLCQSTRPSHRSHSRDPRSAARCVLKNV